jgi:hypothetical protein
MELLKGLHIAFVRVSMALCSVASRSKSLTYTLYLPEAVVAAKSAVLQSLLQ